jgi:colanic acid biosynthesis glycosyl transferase WcaI
MSASPAGTDAASRHRRPHLAILSYNYAPEPTGIPFYNTGMATWFAAHGWRVTVHAGIPHYPWWRVPDDYARRDYRCGRGDEVMDGVEVQRVRHFVPAPPVSGKARMRLDASYLWRTFLRGFTQRRRPDVLVVVAPPFLGGLLGLFLGWRHRIPVCWHVQDLQVDAALELNMLPRRLGGMLLWLERLILARVDLVTTVSQAMRRRLQAKCRTRRPVAMFPNWADATAMRPWTGANRYRQEWGVGDATPVVMYSGNLGRKQGVDVLLEAVTHLRVPHLLVIAGEGAERGDLERRAQELGLNRVRFVPLVPAERLAEFLSAGDLHCIPQRRAAAGLVMPSKLLNLMAVARAVVVTAPAGSDLAEVVAEAGCGAAVEPEDPRRLGEALERLLHDADTRRSSGLAGRRFVQAAYGADTVLGGFAGRLTRMISTARRR